MRRQRDRQPVTVWVFVGIALCLTAVFARNLIVTPEEAVLPEPEPEAVYVPVESRTVSSTFSGSGLIEVGSRTDVVYEGQGEVSIVSASPMERGEEVKFCEPLIEVSGRPVVAMHGAVAGYRDIGEGDTGDDVARLQEALGECGYAVGTDGEFGARTAAAVRSLYSDMGYSTPTREGGAPESSPDPADIEGEGIEEPQRTPPVREVAVPAAEMAFIPEAGWLATAATLNTRVGSDPIATVEHGGLRFVADLPADAMLAAGDDETISIDVGGRAEELTLPELPGVPTFTEEGEPVYPVEVELPPDIDRGLAGTSAAYTFTAGDEAVYPLVIPVSALYSQADGSSFVLHRLPYDDDGTPAAVPVSVVVAGDGYVAVEGDLTEGDQVQVGWQ